jgi:hypothetical protein
MVGATLVYDLAEEEESTSEISPSNSGLDSMAAEDAASARRRKGSGGGSRSSEHRRRAWRARQESRGTNPLADTM